MTKTLWAIVSATHRLVYTPTSTRFNQLVSSRNFQLVSRNHSRANSSDRCLTRSKRRRAGTRCTSLTSLNSRERRLITRRRRKFTRSDYKRSRTTLSSLTCRRIQDGNECRRRGRFSSMRHLWRSSAKEEGSLMISCVSLSLSHLTCLISSNSSHVRASLRISSTTRRSRHGARLRESSLV